MTLDEILALVTQESTVDDSIIALLTQVVTELNASKNDPAKVQAIADGLNANIAKISAAVTANTPSA